MLVIFRGLNLDVPNLITGALEQAFRIGHDGSEIEAQVYMVCIDGYVTNAIALAIRWPIADRHRAVRVIDVLVTRRQLFQYHLTQTERQIPNCRIVRLQKLDQWFWW